MHTNNPFLLIASVLALSLPATAQLTGELDFSFDNDGIKVLDFYGSTDRGADMAVQPDGRIVVACGTDTAMAEHIGVARLLSDGTLDATFSGDGKALFQIGNYCFARAVGVQPDGTIVVGGTVDDVPADHLLLLGIAPDGALDPGFATGGVVNLGLGPDNAKVSDLSILPDGRILTAVEAKNGLHTDMAVLRFLANGALDSSFGVDGVAWAGFPDYSVPLCMAVYPDGRILAAGSTDLNDGDMAWVRMDSTGALDPTFSGDGRQRLDYQNDDDHVDALWIGADGRITSTGLVGWGSTNRTGLVRLLPNGDPDPTFSDDGITHFVPTANAAQEFGRALVLFPDGHGVLGLLQDGTDDGSDLVLLGFNDDGSLDQGFGTAGEVYTDVANTAEIMVCGTLQGDGRFLVLGDRYDEGDVVIARYGMIQNVGVHDDLGGACELRVRPNPSGAAGSVRISGAGGPILGLSVLDMQGRTIQSTPVPKLNEAVLEVNDLPEGLYLVGVRTAQHTTWARLVKG